MSVLSESICVMNGTPPHGQEPAESTSGGSRLPELGGGKGGPEILEGGQGSGGWEFPSGVLGGAPVGGVGDEVPQKPKHFA